MRDKMIKQMQAALTPTVLGIQNLVEMVGAVGASAQVLRAHSPSQKFLIFAMKTIQSCVNLRRYWKLKPHLTNLTKSQEPAVED